MCSSVVYCVSITGCCLVINFAVLFVDISTYYQSVHLSVCCSIIYILYCLSVPCVAKTCIVVICILCVKVKSKKNCTTLVVLFYVNNNIIIVSNKFDGFFLFFLYFEYDLL